MITKVAVSEGRKRAYRVFVKEIQDHVSESGVAPVAVDQQQLLEIPETREGKVARHHRLQHAKKDPTLSLHLRTFSY